jgi:hypothetical protein
MGRRAIYFKRLLSLARKLGFLDPSIHHFFGVAMQSGDNTDAAQAIRPHVELASQSCPIGNSSMNLA